MNGKRQGASPEMSGALLGQFYVARGKEDSQKESKELALLMASVYPNDVISWSRGLRERGGGETFKGWGFQGKVVLGSRSYRLKGKRRDCRRKKEINRSRRVRGEGRR